MKRFVLCALAAACTPVIADEFQVEASLIYGQSETDASFTSFFGRVSTSTDSDILGAGATVYFDKVDTSNGPLAEAAFIDKASGISGSWIDVEDAEDDILGVGLRYVFEGDVILEARYDDLGFSDEVGFGVGTYINDTTDIVFSYTTNNDADADTISLDLHSVVALEDGMSVAYSLGAAYIDANALDGFGIDGDITLYFSDQFGIGVNATYSDLDASEIRGFGISADYFITPSFRVSALYNTSENSDDFIEIDTDTMSLIASIRF